MVREIASAVKVETDLLFGHARAAQERRMMLAFRAINGWDLEILRAERENQKVPVAFSIEARSIGLLIDLAIRRLDRPGSVGVDTL